ncbi:MAG: hypothetical protein CR995_00085 [Clostridiales bacterium]|nr:MAG: hypothetical protein CR995_00085 [Clostridiales bacterium]
MKTADDFSSRIDRLKVIFYAILIGLLAGVFSLVFNLLLTSGTWLVEQLLIGHRAFIIVLPALVYGLLLLSNRYLKSSETAFGIRAVDRELAEIDRHLMKPKAVLIKFFNTIITLCCGFAVGQFGPTVHLGGAIGSNIGYYGKFPKPVIRILIGCGVAAAISAVMQTPLFAAIFVIEVIFSKRYFDYMLPILLSSLVAFFLNFYILGNNRIISFANFDFSLVMNQHDWFWLVSFAVGLGILMALYVFSLKYFALIFAPFKNKIAVYGLLIVAFAALYFSFPAALFTTPSSIVALLGQHNGLALLALLLLVRLLATALQLASGVYGGSFSPVIIIGLIFAALSHGLLVDLSDLQLNLQNWLAFSIVGTISGFASAPVAAVVLALELTGNATILIPAIVVAVVSYFVCDLLLVEQVYWSKEI